MKTLKDVEKNILVSFDEMSDFGSAIVKVSLFDIECVIDCQTGLNHNYQETVWVSCDGDFDGGYDDVLFERISELTGDEDKDDEIHQFVINKIDEEANKNLPENTAESFFEDKGITLEEETLTDFGTFYPSDVCHTVREIEDGFCILYFEDVTEQRIERAIKGYKLFNEEADWDRFKEDVYSGEIGGIECRYGDFRASKAAYDFIIGEQE